MNNLLYRTSVTAQGGRTGRVESHDGRFTAQLSTPKELGGAGGSGLNPEMLFAAGFAACFESALRLVARRQKLAVSDDAAITAEVGLGRSESGGFQLAVSLTAYLPGLELATAEALVAAAHQVCPYSNATRGNIPVTVTLASEAPRIAA
jgi:osmotically inducible protein OsmC